MNQTPRKSTKSPPVSIDYVIPAIFTEHAGTEGHLLRLLRRLDPQYYQPHLTVLQNTTWTATFSDPAVPMTSMGFKTFLKPNGWLTIKKLADHFRKRNTGIVELHTADAHFAGALAARLAKVPVVLSCRRSSGYQYGTKGTLMFRFANRFVTRFIANAESVAAQASKKESVSLDRFEVIYNGVDLASIDDRKHGSIAPAFDSFSAGKRVICSTGNMRPIKNVGCFVRACGEIAKTHNDVVFAMLGEGPERPMLEKLTAELGLGDRSMWLGTTRDIVPYLVRSEIACLSSDSEGFSNSIIEYMAAGLPVVATRVGGNAEAIVDGITGWTCNPGDHHDLAAKLRNVLDMDNEQRLQMGRAGRARVEERFTMDRQMQEYYDLYNRELTAAGGPT